MHQKELSACQVIALFDIRGGTGVITDWKAGIRIWLDDSLNPEIDRRR